MNPDRWRKVESIFQKALDASEECRGAVLDKSCEGDESLRKEVESLLAHDRQAASFIENPAFESQYATATAPARNVVIGTIVNHYRVLGEIGAGGMGVVYKAEDTKLGRLVALKFLPEGSAGNLLALDRFRREARLASALNHPNICTIYEIAEEDGREFIAMEYLEGQTLGTQIASRALSSEGVSRMAIPIAEALNAAHAKGVVHRDVKPGNIFVTSSGLVKVLDFGVAKLIEGSAGLVTEELTAPHAIAGTVAYMAPEQLRGEAVDARSDIYSLGVVLFEMATGHKLYSAKSQLELANEILNQPVQPPSLINPKIASKLEEIILKCLDKDPENRYQTAKEIAVDLRRMALRQPAAAGESTAGRQSGGESPATEPIIPGAQETALMRRLRLRPLAFTFAAVILTGASILIIVHPASPPATGPAIISQIQPSSGTIFDINVTFGAPPQLSPDGRKLVYLANGGLGKSRLWVRPLDSTEAMALGGTDGAIAPFWSPDGRAIGFFAGGKLKKVEVSGGPPVELCLASLGSGGSWAPDGTILFAPNHTSPLYRVLASGGQPVQVTSLNASRQEASHSSPQFLPDGRHFLYYSESAFLEFSGIYLGSLDGGEAKLLLRGISTALYAPPSGLLYVQDGALMARRFDPSRFESSSNPVTIVRPTGTDYVATVSASQGGLLAYVSGTAESGWQMTWFDRTGRPQAIGDKQIYFTPRLSPNDREFAVTVAAPGSPKRDIWIYNVARGTERRLTFDQLHNWTPVWSPDGAKIAYSSNPKGKFHIYMRHADGSGATQPLLEDDAIEYVDSWSADGKYIAYARADPGRKPGWDIWALPLFGDRKPFAVVENQFNKEMPSLSPDGKWLAYASDESGSLEVYIVPFPRGDGKWQVSTNGGRQPRWRGDGRELFFLGRQDKLMATAIQKKDASLELGSPHVLFQADFSPSVFRMYDVTRDGKKFIFVTQPTETGSRAITLIANWTALAARK